MKNFSEESHGIRSRVLHHDIWNVPANVLIITLPEPREMLSSREGLQNKQAICNCYLPKATWHRFDEEPDVWDVYLAEILRLADLSVEETTVLSTGVNMDYLAHGEESFDDLWVKVFVTAGVKSNAMRIGCDRANTRERNGRFETIGTINTIVFTSVELDLSGMAASFITITEAKNIALQEMDVRSAYNPEYRATGTGTDQIIIVPGNGDFNRYVGGHTKIGEMIAKAVTKTTIQAIRNSE